MTTFRIGTSGYSYTEWKGTFYPENLPARRFLAFYAEHLSTVEVNNTFYRMPKRELLSKWKAEVPPSFTFVLKAPQRITHQKRLADVADDVRYFIDTASELDGQLGPLLFQLPPFFHKSAEKLRGLLHAVPAAFRVALEFRHASWHDEEVYRVLRERGAALCCADTNDTEEAVPLVPTASWAYVRLRRPGYDKAALSSWADKLRRFDEAFVFFKHEDAGTGPRLAQELRALVSA
jgi:uncharacterized protein YecE (DUF72 family)